MATEEEVPPPPEPGSLKRRLLFGVSLALSMASIYAGLLNWGRVVQYALAAGAVIAAIAALLTRTTKQGS